MENIKEHIDKIQTHIGNISSNDILNENLKSQIVKDLEAVNIELTDSEKIIKSEKEISKKIIKPIEDTIRKSRYLSFISLILGFSSIFTSFFNLYNSYKAPKLKGNATDGHLFHEQKVFKYKKKMGVICNCTDKSVIIEPKYDYIVQNSVNKYIITNKDNKSSVFDRNGNILIDSKYKYMHYNNSYEFFIACNNEDKWGAIDVKERTLIPFKYNHLYGSVGDTLIFRKKTKTGFITLKNRELLITDFNHISLFNGNHYIASLYKGKGKINMLVKFPNRIIFKAEEDIENLNSFKRISNTFYILASKKNKWGIVSDKNKIIHDFNLTYNSALRYLNGFSKDNTNKMSPR